MKDITNTVDLMASSDYSDRFLAEYWQTKIRYEKLKTLITKWEAINRSHIPHDSGILNPYWTDLQNTLGFTPSVPFEILAEQLHIMGEYLHLLEIRAVIEKIYLGE